MLLKVALERPELMEGVKLFNIGYHTLFAIPIVVFGFNCHAMVVTIFHELEVCTAGLGRNKIKRDIR